MKTKITESDLSSRSASLREKIAQLESQQTDEGFFDAIKSGWNKLTGSGQPAAAPAAAAPAPAAAAPAAAAPGKPGEAPQAQAQAAAGPAGAPPKPAANAKEQQYNTALKQIKDLYAKAKVQYPPQDDIVRQRYGLPPALPPLAQWDGKMPQSTGADFLTRNLFGRDGSKAVAGQQAANNISNTANAKSDAETEADVKELGTLVAQLKDILAGKGPTVAPISLNEHMPSNLLESLARLNKKIRLMETLPQDPAQRAAAAAPPTLDTTGKDSGIQKIKDLMAKINGNNEDPPQDVAQALSDAQAAIDQFEAAAKNTPAGVSLDNGVNAQGQNTTIKNADGSTTNPETGVTTPAVAPGKAINPETGEEYTPVAPGKAINPETGEEYTPVAPAPNLQDIVKQSLNKQTAPGKAINPETGEEYTPVAPVQTAAAPTQKKYGGYGQATAESVSYRDDQALARIVELSRR